MAHPDTPVLKRTPLYAARVRLGIRAGGGGGVGTELAVEVRGQPQRARVVTTPVHPPRVKKA